MTDTDSFKHHFPIFRHQPNLVYLDSAATALKPQMVIDTLNDYYSEYSANVGRGLYPLAEVATATFEEARAKVARFIGAKAEEIIFTSGTTTSINLATQLVEQSLFPVTTIRQLTEKQSQDNMIAASKTPRSNASNIVVTEMEHHSNFLPWKELALRNGATLRVVPLTEEGIIDIDILKESLDEQTKVVAFSAVSNVLGTINPVKKMIRAIRTVNPRTLVLVDAAQAVGHQSLDVTHWDADFVAFSGHKCFGPTGVGVLFGKKEILKTLPPVTFGGGMVLDVHPTGPGRACAAHPAYKNTPYRFEAGTPNIGGGIAFGAALDFIKEIGIENIRSHEIRLTGYALQRLQETFPKDLRILGPMDPKLRVGIISFTLDDVHPHDLAHLLGEENICVRAGEHCAAPLHRALGLPATTRISFSIYNTEQDIDRLIAAMRKIHTLFKR